MTGIIPHAECHAGSKSLLESLAGRVMMAACSNPPAGSYDRPVSFVA